MNNEKLIELRGVSKSYDGFVSDHYGVIAEFVND